MQPTAQPKPREMNALRLLEAALGASLAELAAAATARAAAGIAAGRTGTVHTNAYAAGLGYASERLEVQRDEAASRLRAAIAELDASDRQIALGEDADAQRQRVEKERAAFDDVDGRLGIIAAYGKALCIRAVLVDAHDDAKAALADVRAAHARAAAALENFREPSADDLPTSVVLSGTVSTFNAAARRTVIAAEQAARERVYDAEGAEVLARCRLVAWAEEYPMIARSLTK